MFGRGGEEALALVEAGIPFRVIPGISAAIGALANVGIPLTHRETNSAVTFLTGHGAAGDVPHGINWKSIALASPVLVIYMALRHLDQIQRELLIAGRAKGEPVAIVSKATTPDEIVVESTLGACVEDVKRNDIAPPAIVILGEVVRLRSGLDWAGAMDGRVLQADPLGTRAVRDAG